MKKHLIPAIIAGGIGLYVMLDYCRFGNSAIEKEISPFRSSGMGIMGDALASPQVNSNSFLEEQGIEIQAEVNRSVVLSFAGSGDHSNPYTDVKAHVLFRGPDDASFKVSAFWDGGAIWRVRFTPPKAGLWTFSTHSEDDRLLDGHCGNIQAGDAGNEGFIVRDADHSFVFGRRNGRPILPMGDTLWNGMSDCMHALDFDTYREYIDIRSQQKFNFVRAYICSFYRDSTSPFHKNEGGWAFHPWNPDFINPGYFRNVEKRIAYANSKGITVHLLFGSDRTNLTDFFGWSNGKLERYVRYCCARFAALDIAWEGRAEFEEQRKGAIGSPDMLILARQLGAWVRKYDPFGHLQSVHTVDSNNELGHDDWLDWIMNQSRDWNLIVRDRIYGKPILNEEFFYENSGAGMTHAHHVDADSIRKGAWKIMTSGAAGFAYGNTGTYNSRSQPFRGLEFAESPGARYMTHLYTFWSSLEYWKLTPDITRHGPFVVSNPGEQYVAYLENGGTREIFIDHGEYGYRWFNPRTGEWYGDPNRIISKGENILFSAPERFQDCVLHVSAIH